MDNFHFSSLFFQENSALQLSSKSSLSESSLMAELGQQSGSGFNASGMYGVHGGANGPHGLHSGSSGSRGGQAVSEQLMNKDSLLIHKLELVSLRSNLLTPAMGQILMNLA